MCKAQDWTHGFGPPRGEGPNQSVPLALGVCMALEWTDWFGANPWWGPNQSVPLRAKCARLWIGLIDSVPSKEVGPDESVPLRAQVCTSLDRTD